MSDTPRTDEKVLIAWECFAPTKYVQADFSRQLERENTALLAALDPERIIAAIDLPGGHYCDPQAVADAIRAYCSTALVAHGSRNP